MFIDSLDIWGNDAVGEEDVKSSVLVRVMKEWGLGKA
jgi:hypothetical protein